MASLLPSGPTLLAFVAASVLLAVTPGPGVLYIVTRSIAGGRRAGLASVIGVAAGNFGNAVGAALGLSALFALSALAFDVVKLAGAAYLIALGIRALRSPAGPVPAASPAGGGSALRDGFVVALLNPKTALFFAAFLPQFVPAGAPPMAASVALGALFVGIAATTDTVWAVAAGAVAPMLSRPGAATAGRWVVGGTFIGLGLLTACSGRARAR